MGTDWLVAVSSCDPTTQTCEAGGTPQTNCPINFGYVPGPGQTLGYCQAQVSQVNWSASSAYGTTSAPIVSNQVYVPIYAEGNDAIFDLYLYGSGNVVIDFYGAYVPSS